MSNRCVIDRKLRFEFASDLEQTIFHASRYGIQKWSASWTTKSSSSEVLRSPTTLSLIREFGGEDQAKRRSTTIRNSGKSTRPESVEQEK